MFDWIKDNKIVTFFQGINSLPGKIIVTALWFLFMILFIPISIIYLAFFAIINIGIIMILPIVAFKASKLNKKIPINVSVYENKEKPTLN
jgi:hypothetical protein